MSWPKIPPRQKGEILIDPAGKSPRLPGRITARCVNEECGREFTCYRSYFDKGKRTCSRACWAYLRRRKREVICSQCGARFMKKPSEIAKARYNVFCSTDCRNAFNAAELRELNVRA